MDRQSAAPPRADPSRRCRAGPVEDPIEAAFLAGAALNSLDNLVQGEPEWSGAWRHRLAPKAASASMTLIGRSEDEAALRDAWLRRRPGDAPGPAGAMCLLRGAGSPAVEDLQAVTDLLGFGWSDGLGELIDAARDAMRKGASAPVVAARIVFFTELPRNAYRRCWSQIPTRLAWRVLSWMEDRGPKRNISADGNLSPNPQILIKDLIENGFRAVEA